MIRRAAWAMLVVWIVLGAWGGPKSALAEAKAKTAAAATDEKTADGEKAADQQKADRRPLETVDWTVIGLYFALLLGVAWWVIAQGKETADDYFLAGRNLGWFLVGASIFASNIGSEHLVGLAGSGCTDGVAMAHYELHAWCLLVLAWVLVPFYARSMVFTMPEFLERRFSPTARWVLSIISLVAYVLTKLAVGVFAGGIVFDVLMPEAKLSLPFVELNGFWIGSIAVILLTGLYTILGGMRAVAYNDAIQTVVLIIGSLLLTVYGLDAIGGWSGLRESLDPDLFNLWKPLVPKEMTGTWEPVKEPGRIAWYFNDAYPWLGMLFCAPIIGLWYWCTDQYIVQRALGAPNERIARRGSICAAFLKLLPVFIFIIPGMVCIALASSGKNQELRQTLMPDAPAVAEGDAKPFTPPTPQQDPEFRERCQGAFPLMVKTVLPVGVRGIVVAGLLSALMSSLAGAFNACSTLFTMDLYVKFRPQSTQKQLVWIGRVATAGMVLIALLWIPVIQNAKGLYHYLQSVQGYLAPPIFVVFFFGVFFKRLNAKGCLAALIVGFLMGAFRLAVDTPVMLDLGGLGKGYAQGSFLWIVNNIYFQYYSVLVLLVSMIAMVVVSLMTEVPPLQQIRGLTYGTVSQEEKAKSRSSWTWGDVAASLLVIAIIIGAYVYFNG
jgi:SSS family solute:Na+ symporter